MKFASLLKKSLFLKTFFFLFRKFHSFCRGWVFPFSVSKNYHDKRFVFVCGSHLGDFIYALACVSRVRGNPKFKNVLVASETSKKLLPFYPDIEDNFDLVFLNPQKYKKEIY